MFLFSFGSIQLLCLTDTEIVKEISLCTSLSQGKPPYLVKDSGALVGQGIGSSSGPIWAHQMKIIVGKELGVLPKWELNQCFLTFPRTKSAYNNHVLQSISSMQHQIHESRNSFVPS